MRRRRSSGAAVRPLAGLLPGPGRWLGVVLVGGLLAMGSWAAGVETGRAVLLVACGAVVVLTWRLSRPEDVWRWPVEPAVRSRPGWHGAAQTLRALERAEVDPDDRRLALARVGALGPHPAAEGLRRAVTTRRPGTYADSRSTS